MRTGGHARAAKARRSYCSRDRDQGETGETGLNGPNADETKNVDKQYTRPRQEIVNDWIRKSKKKR